MSNINSYLNGNDDFSLQGRARLLEAYNALDFASEMPKRLKNLNEQSIGRHLESSSVEWQVAQDAVVPSEEYAKDPAEDEINKAVKAQAAKQFIQQFYTLYMDPGNDIKWRLGEVENVVKNPKVLTANGKNFGLTDDHGFLYTKSNFFKRYKVPAYMSRRGSNIETYTNFWFPPFSKPLDKENSKSLGDFCDISDATMKFTEKQRNQGGDGTFFDYNKMIDYRGNFTYRKPAFKQINDSISWLQWLFERVSGITSTYLTDWDLSLYMQESMTTSFDPTSVKWVELCHRMCVDHPFAGPDPKNPIRPEIGYAFGVMNCAVSKLTGTNKQAWFPESYPLSTYWLPYPNWRCRKSQIKKLYVVDEEDTNKRYVYATPKFWHIAAKNEMAYLCNRSMPIRTRITFDDYQGAALAGWDGIHHLSNYQALYTTPDDGLSNQDVRLMEGMNVFTLNYDLILENFEDAFGVPLESPELPPEKEEDPNYYDASDDYSASVPSGGGHSGERIGGGKWSKVSKIASLFNGRGGKADAAQRNAGSANSAFSTPATPGYDPKTGKTNISQADQMMARAGIGGSNAPKNADSANCTGICQKNPPLYGGPHSPQASPLSTQSYMEPNNSNLRNVPRVAPDGSFYDDPFQILSAPGDTNKYQFNGNEKFYSQAGHFGNEDTRVFEHSYSNARQHLNEGIYDYTWDTCYYYGTQWNIYYRQSCPYCWSGHYPSYDYYNGGYIHYSHYTSYYQYENLGWWWWWGWGWYRWNTNYYYDWVWWDWRRGQYRARVVYYGYYGYVWTTIAKRYKKYRLHSMPFEHWQIRHVTHMNWYGSWYWNWWWRGWWSWFGWNRYYYCGYNSGRDDYELRLPDYWTYKGVNAYTYNHGYRYLRQSWGEKEVIQKMVDIAGGRNASAYLIFLDGNYSWWDRYYNGPRNIFQMKVTHRDYQYKYLVLVGCSHRCHCDYWYEERIGYTDYLSVDPNDVKNMFIGLDRNYFTNNYPSNNTDFIQKSTVSYGGPGYTRTGNPTDFMRYIGYDDFLNRWNYMQGSWYGLEGYGILSCIPGVDSSFVDDPFPALNYRQYMACTFNQQTQRLYDAPLKVYHTSWWGGSCHQVNGRNWYFPNGGMPTVWTYSMDWSLKRNWLRACTTGTFYIDQQFKKNKGANYYGLLNHFYKVPIDVPLRTFYFQMIYQRTYLYALRELFCGHLSDNDGYGWQGNPSLAPIVDFHQLGKLMKGTEEGPGICGQRVYELCDPSPDLNKKMMPNPSPYAKAGEKVDKCRIYGFNQWIRMARSLFDEPFADETLIKFRNEIDKRISLFNQFISYFEGFVRRDALSLTLNEIDTATSQIQQLVNFQINDRDNMIIEESLYSYMNILYEYRRFFVDMRCNKQDGPLWLMRSLESAMPMLINDLNAEHPASPETRNNAGGEYDVVFTGSNLKFRDKIQLYKDCAAAHKNPSEELMKYDKVQKLYIKVSWATEEEYNTDRKKVENGELQEPTIIKVRRWDWERSKDGALLVDKDGNPIRKMYGDYRYAKKPKDGKYRLENTLFRSWLSTVDANKKATTNEEKETPMPEDMKEFIWNIKWGLPYSTISKEQGETDIIYDIKSFIEVNAINGAFKGDPSDFPCSGGIGIDYWEVPVKSELPLKTLFPNGSKIKIKKYTDPKGPDDLPSTNPLGPFALTGDPIWPIVERQQYKGMDIKKVAENLLEKTKNLV